ncbi:MAG: 1-deoxy-D-xylulose-5-phosphate reductoisomerase [Alphaproteobacteria bacterium]
MVGASDANTENASARRKRITVLGATGSIGASTVDLLRRYPQQFAVEAVTANRDAKGLAKIATDIGAKIAVVADPSAYGELKAAVAGTGIAAAAGADALLDAAARPVDLVVAAIVGAAGLAPTMAAIEAGSDIALANKECLVCAGALFMKAVARKAVRLLPVDSEHNAIFQALGAGGAEAVDKIILTASGGPFRDWTAERLANATPDQAAHHPNWSMGKKISVDSSTLLNKGFELIEAHYLFDIAPDQIEVLVHPQSIVHGLVVYRDGSVISQMSVTDMRVPLGFCLWWPERRSAPRKRLDLTAVGSLTFEDPDPVRFPGLQLARRALEAGGWATNVLNAANEVAVDAFLKGALAYPDIVGLSDQVLSTAVTMNFPSEVDSLEDSLAIDREGRRIAREALVSLPGQ